MKKLMIAALAALMGLAASATMVTVYVAPNGSDANDGSAAKPVLNLSRALQLTRTVTNATARRIVVKDGLYKIETNLVRVTKQDVNLTIEAEHVGKAVFSGAERVTGWEPYPDDKRFLMAKLPFKAKPYMLYMLSIGGANAEMASFPDFGGENKMPYLASEADVGKRNRTVMKYDSLALPKGQTFEGLDLESAWVTVPQEWATTRSYILTNDWKNDTFVFKTPINMPLGRFNTGFQIVNCRLGMRKPGMWMFEASKGRLVYWPKAGETAAKLNEIASVSSMQAFLSVEQAQNFVLRGITVEALSSPFYDGNPRPVAVFVAGGYAAHTNDYRMTVEDCEIRNTAGYGIQLSYANGTMVRRCHIHHTGATGLETKGSSFGLSVISNHLHHCSTFNTSGACMSVAASKSRYDFNHVHHSPYAGVVMWSSHSTFNSNHLHHTMLSARDGGGLYGGYMFCDLVGNWTHDTGNWPGLYNDEGGQRCTFAFNRFEGSWWPFHMHCCYGIVVTNNTITCDDGMRFSFMDSCHCIFKDNVIRTTKKIVADPYVRNCDVWDNVLELKQRDGSYQSAGRISFSCEPLPAKGPYECYASYGDAVNVRGDFVTWFASPCSKVVPIDRLADGRYAHGVPGCEFQLIYDSTNLYFHGIYTYNQLAPYEGSKHFGADPATCDAVKFHFKDYSVTFCLDSPPSPAVDSKGERYPKNTFNCNRVPSLGDGKYWLALEIPWEKIGLKFKTASDLYGKEIPFNIEFVNVDHNEHRFYNQPDGDNYLTGRLAFVPEHEIDQTGEVDGSMVLVGKGLFLPGAMAPFGRVQGDVETAYRHRDDYADAKGYEPRNLKLMGFTFRDRADRFTTGHRAFLLQPFTGEEPVGAGRRSQHLEQASQKSLPGRFDVNVQRWDLETSSCASANAVYHNFCYMRGGIFKVLVDGNFADGEVEASELKVEGRVLTGHLRAKANGVLAKGYDAWLKAEFNQTPVEVKELATPGKGQRLLLVFDIMPQVGDIVVKATISEASAEDAEKRFAADGWGLDYAAAKAAAIASWQEVFLGQKKAIPVFGDKKSVCLAKSAVYGAYMVPGGSEKTFKLVQNGEDYIDVAVRGLKNASSKLKTATVNGKPIPPNFPAKWRQEILFFHNGDKIELEFE